MHGKSASRLEFRIDRGSDNENDGGGLDSLAASIGGGDSLVVQQSEILFVVDWSSILSYLLVETSLFSLFSCYSISNINSVT